MPAARNFDKDEFAEWERMEIVVEGRAIGGKTLKPSNLRPGGLMSFSEKLSKKMDPRHMKLFTMLELLVVIAIITILASMLLPALRGAREAGKSIQCMGQLKQIGVTLYSYADDYDSYTPNGWNQSHWADYLLPYLGQRIPYLYCSLPYLDGKNNVFYCPNADTFPILWKLNWWKNGLTYATMQTPTANNSPYLAGTSWSFKLTSPELQKPLSRIGYAADASNCYFSQTSAYSSVSPYDNVAQPLKRHLNSCNIVYLDGHCAAFNGNMIWNYPGCVQHEFQIK